MPSPVDRDGTRSLATLLAKRRGVDGRVQRSKVSRSARRVHLKRFAWQPLTHDPDLRAILDDSGCFAGNRLREVNITGALRAALVREWCAQVARIQAAGVQISHLDSHHHMHTVPACSQC